MPKHLTIKNGISEYSWFMIGVHRSSDVVMRQALQRARTAKGIWICNMDIWQGWRHMYIAALFEDIGQRTEVLVINVIWRIVHGVSNTFILATTSPCVLRSYIVYIGMTLCSLDVIIILT